MVEQSSAERVYARFGTYIAELQEFFVSRGISFGSPEDMVSLAEECASPGPLQEEMGSLVRSIQYREDDRLGRGELLEIVTLSIGGPEVQVTARDTQHAVRQVILFVNRALRERHWDLSSESAEPEPPALAVQPMPETVAVRKRAEDRFVTETEASESGKERVVERGPAAPGTREARPATAVAVEESSSFPTYGSGPITLTRRPWFLPAAGVLMVAGLAAVFLGRPGAVHPGNSPVAPAAGSATPLPSQPTTAAACVAPSRAGTSRSAVEERLRWAHGLLDQKLYEAALPELQTVASMDPSYPGIQLDESGALLQMKRPEDARDAINTQIGISDCLARLPGPALDAYCSAEFPPATQGSCRGQLTRIRQAAELQAALVHLELGHQAAPDAGMPEPQFTEDLQPGAGAPAPVHTAAVTAAPVRTVHTRRTEPLPPATEEDNSGAAVPRPAVEAKSAATGRADRKSSGGDDALRRGEGTDSAYGAYSRPQ